MALKYANISYIHREVKLSERPKELYKISSKGTVPVLHISDSEIIDESIEIMHYALNKRDIDNWYIFNKPLQNKLIEKNDGPFKKALDRYKYHVRFKEDSYESYQDQVSKLLNEYDIILDDQNFLINDHIFYRKNKKLLEKTLKLRNSKKGKKVFLFATGPSINILDPKK
mgnify:CR=1 FL=1